MGQKPARASGPVRRQHDSSVKSTKTWKQKSVVHGYVVTDEDGADHEFEKMHDAILFFWS